MREYLVNSVTQVGKFPIDVNIFGFEMHVAPLGEYPHQMQTRIIRVPIFIIQKHIVVVGMVAGGQSTAHKLGECVPVIQIHGSPQLQFVSMAAEDVFDIVLPYKINYA